jgi:microcystin-dependent protein
MKISIEHDLKTQPIPVGMVDYFHRNDNTDGWLFADGGEYDPILYPNLFNLIGYKYGFGNINRSNPIMTSTTAPSGTVFYSSQYDATTYQSWKAFNGVYQNDCWITANGVTTGWIAYKYTTQQTIGGYRVCGYINTSSILGSGYTPYPKAWTFMGSNDTTNGLDGTWTTLDTQTSETSWGVGEKRCYKIKSPQPFQTYKLNITANNGYANYTLIGELDLYNEVDIVKASLPDLRGEFIRGADLGRGVDPGRLIGTFQMDEVYAHSHTAPPANNEANVNIGATNRMTNVTGGMSGGTSVNYTNYVGALDTRPRNVALLPYIKY